MRSELAAILEDVWLDRFQEEGEHFGAEVLHFSSLMGGRGSEEEDVNEFGK